MTTPERSVEEKYDKLVLELMGQSAFSAYVGSYHHAKIKEFIHQELQKAREEERERCITEAWSYIVDATHAESWGREELRKRLTPPDQTANPTK